MVGNLRIVVSWSSVLTVMALCMPCGVSGIVLAQGDAAAEAPADPAAESPPAAEAPAEPAAPKTTVVAYAEPRITEAQDREWRSKRQIKFQNALKAIAPTNAETKELVDGANLFVDRMSIPKLLPDLHRNVIDPARRSAEGQLTQSKPRGILLKAMTDRGVELLAQNPPHHPDVQLGIVILLSTLNAQPAGTNTMAVPFTGSSRALIGVLENPASPLQCRITAASGLGRMGREAAVGVSMGDLSVVQRNEISASLAKVLLSSDAKGNDDGKLWFRGRLAEALGDCGVAYDLNKGSVYIDALMTTVTTPGENIRVRAIAVRAASQLQWDGQTNLPLVLSETMKLVAEVGRGYDAAVAAKKAIPTELRHANLELYFAFQPKTIQQVGLNWGLLNQIRRNGLSQHGPAVTAAYQASLPVINHVLTNSRKGMAIPAAQLAAIQAWIDANPPKDRKLTPVSPAALP